MWIIVKTTPVVKITPGQHVLLPVAVKEHYKFNADYIQANRRQSTMIILSLLAKTEEGGDFILGARDCLTGKLDEVYPTMQTLGVRR